MYDSHDIYVAAQAQLESEGGVDTQDLHAPDSHLRCLRLAQRLLVMHELGFLKEMSPRLHEEVGELIAAEVEAIAEEIEAQQQYENDAWFDRLKEDGYA